MGMFSSELIETVISLANGTFTDMALMSSQGLSSSAPSEGAGAGAWAGVGTELPLVAAA